MSYQVIKNVVQQTAAQRQQNPLYQRCEAIAAADVVSAEIIALRKNMLAVCRAASGAGIAANQVGVAKQLFLIGSSDPDAVRQRYQFDEDFPERWFINPIITRVSEERVRSYQGCLSDLGGEGEHGQRRGLVSTYQTIDIEAYDEHAKPVRETLTGFNAIAFQHEFLHLLGYTYLDVATEFVRLDELTPEQRCPQLTDDLSIPCLLEDRYQLGTML